jgi:hypothetical protein
MDLKLTCICRALAIILPSVTLMAHAASFAVLKSVFAESWGSSFAATYDLFAAAASAMGLLGALQVRDIPGFGRRIWLLLPRLHASKQYR